MMNLWSIMSLVSLVTSLDRTMPCSIVQEIPPPKLAAQPPSDKLTAVLNEMRSSVALRHLTDAEFYQSGAWNLAISRNRQSSGL